jgi:hypothetical protein
VKKDLNWFKERLDDIEMNSPSLWSHNSIWMLDRVNELLDQLDEPEVLSHEWIDENKKDSGVHYIGYYVPIGRLHDLLVPKQEEVDRAYKNGYEKGKQHTFYKGYLEGLAEGERKTNEYFESITEEPSYEQVQKYLSEHGIEVVGKEPETVADVITDFFKSLERLKEVMSMEVEEMEE